jgi:hypothetical protein
MIAFFHAVRSATQEVKDITEVGETLAYTWFGRPNWAYSSAAQKYWIGSTKDTLSGTTQHITEYDINEDKYITTQLGSVYEKDDHNQCQIIIRQSDNRLIAFYTEHNGTRLRYRISLHPLDSKTWGGEKVLNPYSSYSYLSPYQNNNGHIYIFFRVRVSGVSTWYYMKSTDGAETFGSAVELFGAGATHNYLISCQDDNKIHFAASNGHPQTNSNININVYHFYFDMDNDIAYNSDGVALVLPLSNSTITLVSQTTANNTSWILDVTVKNGNPRVLFIYYPNGRVNGFYVKELFFAEYNNGWVTPIKISETMQGYIEDDYSIQEYAYDGASRFDTVNPDIIWMPKQVNGILEIHKVDLGVNPMYVEQLTFNSEKNNWRPISVPSDVNNLLWLRNNGYFMYTDYDISLMTSSVTRQ